MIEYKVGDILADESEALVNSVNCVGVMGKGIARQFKDRFPANFRAYHDVCERGDLKLGSVFVYVNNMMWSPRYIINFPTKDHWRSRSKLTDIEMGIAALKDEIVKRRIRSIAIPPLGSGLGGLSWTDVKPLIETALGDLADVRVTVYEPLAVSADAMAAGHRRKPKMTPGRAALIGLMGRYLKGLLDPFVTLLEVHKLMYFMQEAGEPLKLKYVEGDYGPYATNLQYVLRSMDPYFITGYGDEGDQPGKPIELADGALDQAIQVLQKQPSTLARFERVSALVEGFESGPGLEILATVHWVSLREPDAEEADVVAATRKWGPAKSKFSDRQILLALYTLRAKGWLPV